MSPPEVWGPAVWTLFHTLIEKVNDQAYPFIKVQLFGQIRRICGFLPCPECSSDATIFLAKVNVNDLIKACNLTDSLSNYSDVELEAAEILVKYEGYIKKEKDLAEKLERLDDVALKQNFDYSAMKSLSLEAREKIKKHKPQTLGQASRISGISPSDISVLMVAMGR